jgi:hypothetical protein
MLLDVLPPVVHLQSETDRERAFNRMRQELTVKSSARSRAAA